MSKTQLKKELQGFTKEQLQEIILAAYDSSAKAKEYFEFFINPDANALMEKGLDIVQKELKRTKWGECKARISIIRKVIKEYAAFGVGAENHAKMVLTVLAMVIHKSTYYHLSEPLSKGMLGFASEYVTIAANNGFLEQAICNVGQVTDEYARPRIAAEIHRQIDSTVQKLKTL